jgi:hypothetical protein
MIGILLSWRPMLQMLCGFHIKTHPIVPSSCSDFPENINLFLLKNSTLRMLMRKVEFHFPGFATAPENKFAAPIFRSLVV